ncbi:MAG: hypothetical protein M1823_003980 [Watsoniomyces obsoletus]|nr:MAG: hypothetical protein M1823_003980 [Watsoniomyces obsoletus]
MKKIFHRPRGQSHSARSESPEADDALKASPYERTTSRTPPRVGTTPLKGDHHEPLPSLEPVAIPPEHPLEASRETPTNFSRRPPTRGVLGVPMTHNGPPSPTAIQPRDLASPEYSYLSNVYGGQKQPADPMPQRDIPDVLVPGHQEPIHRKEIGSGPSSRTSMDPERVHQEQGEAADKLQKVVNLHDTVDTEVITKQAPGEYCSIRRRRLALTVAAAIHERVISEVHHVREERIEREIHTHDVIHRIQPIIDIEVLPPRHFVPTEQGTLKEVSADEIPARRGHWGIVETVTKPSGAATAIEPTPEIVQLPASTVDGIRRTEDIIRHPPTRDTGARDAGQSWPMLIVPDHYERIHGLPAGQHPPHVPEPRRLEDAALTLQQRTANEPVAPPVAAEVKQDVAGPSEPVAASTVENPQTVPRAPGVKNKVLMPGMFPDSSASTATLRTVYRPN